MEYTDTYHFLNPHLHTAPTPALTGLKHLYTVTRKAPTILCYKDETKIATMNMYKFSPQIFETHQAHFVKHFVKAVKRNPEGFFRIINAYTRWGNGYYHFLTEVLPSVLEISKPYTIHTMKSKFAQAVFQWFDVKNTVSFDKPTFTNVKESLEQQYVECGNPSPQKVQLIRNIVQKKVTNFLTRLIFRLFYRKNDEMSST